MKKACQTSLQWEKNAVASESSGQYAEEEEEEKWRERAFLCQCLYSPSMKSLERRGCLEKKKTSEKALWLMKCEEKARKYLKRENSLRENSVYQKRSCLWNGRKYENEESYRKYKPSQSISKEAKEKWNVCEKMKREEKMKIWREAPSRRNEGISCEGSYYWEIYENNEEEAS